MKYPIYPDKLSPEKQAKWLAEEKTLLRVMLAAIYWDKLDRKVRGQ